MVKLIEDNGRGSASTFQDVCGQCVCHVISARFKQYFADHCSLSKMFPLTVSKTFKPFWRKYIKHFYSV